jgi:hypothetical protein
MSSHMGIEDVLMSILALLKHIKKVEQEIEILTQKSSGILIKEITTNDIIINDEILEAIQLQDIITQQFSAVSIAIDDIEKHVDAHMQAMRIDNAIFHMSIEKLHTKMIDSLNEAKKKQDSFTGNSLLATENRTDEIEFF